MKTLLTGGVIVTCDGEHNIYSPGDLVLEEDRITYVGPAYDGEYDERIPTAGHLLMPGLINAHTHSPMSLFRSLSDDVDLQVFLYERAWPREVKLTGEDVYAGTVLSAIEMLKSGVTTYVDMYFFEESLAQAALDLGIRAVVTPGIVESPTWESVLGNWEKRTADVLEFCEQWDGSGGLIHTGLGPHAPYTLPLPALGEIASEARRAGYPVHIHLVETKYERDTFGERNGASTASVLDRLGFFDGDVLAAHNIWLDDGDLNIYSSKGVGVANCPQSNAKLGAGIAPAAAMLAAGVQVGLGTDGAATNNNHDLWEEIRLAPMLAKVSALDPKLLPTGQVLWMATRMGAHAIHRPDLGMLAQGYKADVIMLDIEDTNVVPIFSPTTYIDHLVYSVGRELVRSVWVNGKQVVRGGEVLTVDEEEARYRAQEAAMAVSERAGKA